LDHVARSDAELLALARQGWASALGAMLHRHGPAVAEVVRGARDPERAVLDTFTEAIRALETAPEDDVAGWLRGLASGHAPEDSAADTPAPDEHAEPDDAPEPDLDAIWARLADRWPHGRARLRIPPALAWALAVVATIALGAGLPWLTLGPLGEEPELPQLRAFPIDDEREVVDPDDSTEEEGEEEADEPLPTYEFPTPPAEVDEPAEEADPDGPDAPADDPDISGAEPDGPGTQGADDTPSDPDDPDDPDAPPTEEQT
jgi:hypothetical protein